MTVFGMLAVAAYLAGSVNFAILLFRMLGKADPREGFSGNPGTTNVYRLAGWRWALVVLMLDVGRAASVAWAAACLLPIGLVPPIGFALILGNAAPCFHGFRGGKGVANYLGFTLLIAPLWAAAGAIVWASTAAALRIPFIGSLAMVAILGAGTVIACGVTLPPVAGVLATVALIGGAHRSNIIGLLRRRNR